MKKQDSSSDDDNVKKLKKEKKDKSDKKHKKEKKDKSEKKHKKEVKKMTESEKIEQKNKTISLFSKINGLNNDSESDDKDMNKYEHPKTEIKCSKDKRCYPYGTQWIHDKQEDDDITEIEKRRGHVLDALMSVEYPEQKSEGWFKLRDGRATASDGGCILGQNEKEAQYKFLIKKVKRPPFESNIFCHHGTKYEHIATMVYEYRMNCKVEEFGLVAHPTIYYLAASPDGIVSHYKMDGKSKTKYVGRMLEIKCPYSRQIKTSGEIKGEICPIYYWIQVQLQLECCDLDECDFWQCKIEEYEDREDFMKDTDINEPFRSKKTGMEKGCVIRLLPKEKISQEKTDYTNLIYNSSKFLYPPRIEMSPLECDGWIAQSMANYNLDDYYFDKVLYWRMSQTSCVTIYRELDWFNENKDTIGKIWKLVEYFRNNKEKSDLFFDYIDTLNRKENKKIMEIASFIANEPDDNDENALKKYSQKIMELQERVNRFKNDSDHDESDD